MPKANVRGTNVLCTNASGECPKDECALHECLYKKVREVKKSEDVNKTIIFPTPQ
jgi:hypothetical protein